MPSAAMRSMLGVWAALLPKQEKSPQPMSSMKIMTMFGLGAATAEPQSNRNRKMKRLMRWVRLLGACLGLLCGLADELEFIGEQQGLTGHLLRIVGALHPSIESLT